MSLSRNSRKRQAYRKELARKAVREQETTPNGVKLLIPEIKRVVVYDRISIGEQEDVLPFRKRTIKEILKEMGIEVVASFCHQEYGKSLDKSTRPYLFRTISWSRKDNMIVVVPTMSRILRSSDFQIGRNDGLADKELKLVEELIKKEGISFYSLLDPNAGFEKDRAFLNKLSKGKRMRKSDAKIMKKRALNLKIEGRTIEEISQELDVSRNTIINWICR